VVNHADLIVREDSLGLVEVCDQSVHDLVRDLNVPQTVGEKVELAVIGDVVVDGLVVVLATGRPVCVSIVLHNHSSLEAPLVRFESREIGSEQFDAVWCRRFVGLIVAKQIAEHG